MPLTRTYVPEGGMPFGLTVAATLKTLSRGIARQRMTCRLIRRTIQPTGWHVVAQLQLADGKLLGEDFQPAEVGVQHDEHGWFIWDGEPYMSAEQIIRALALHEPLGGFDYECGECMLCHLGPFTAGAPEDPTEAHAVSCPWRQAVIWCREHHPEET